MGTAALRADLLGAILAGTRRIVEVRQARTPLADVARRADLARSGPARFAAALSRPDAMNVIAECKRRSPARGVLRKDYDPVAIASGYQTAGAAAISILTEPTFFDGAIEHLEAVRAAVSVPLLRKDFIVSEYQLLEAKAAGADAVLLIVAALNRRDLATLLGRAADLDLDVLVEVHDAAQLEIALDARAGIVGVNNRDLRTMTVDLGTSERLVARIPADVIAVSESGLRTCDDLLRLRDMGYRAFLVGERFMTDADPAAALARLLRETARVGEKSKPATWNEPCS